MNGFDEGKGRGWSEEFRCSWNFIYAIEDGEVLPLVLIPRRLHKLVREAERHHFLDAAGRHHWLVFYIPFDCTISDEEWEGLTTETDRLNWLEKYRIAGRRWDDEEGRAKDAEERIREKAAMRAAMDEVKVILTARYDSCPGHQFPERSYPEQRKFKCRLCGFIEKIDAI